MAGMFWEAEFLDGFIKYIVFFYFVAQTAVPHTLSLSILNRNKQEATRGQRS